MSLILILIYIALPLTGLLVNRFVWKKRFSPIILFFLLCVFGYLLLMVSVQVRGYELKADLNRYDLDGNGLFGGKEITPEMKEAMRRVTSDTGRTLAPLTGVPITGIFIGLNFVAFYFVAWLIGVITSPRTKTEQGASPNP